MNSFTKRGSWSVVLSLLLMASAILSGCSGGGSNDAPATTTGTGTGSALQLAEKISVVDAKSTSTGAAQLRIGKFKVAPSTVTAAGTDWTKDVTQVFVHERSEEAFGTINEILCAIGQTQYDEMVNKGDYKALIDNNLCSQKRDSAESAGQESTNQSSGSTAPDYETWTVNSARADSNAGTPQIVKVWVHEKERSEGGGHTEPAKVIEAKATITEGVSATNPYGLFTMNFAAYPVLNGTKSSTAMFKGMLMSEKDATTGKILLKFVMDGGFTNPQTGIQEQSMTEKSVLDRAADGSTGSGSAYHSFTSTQGTQSFSETGSFNIAFNTANFLRQDTTGGTPVCLDRINFDETAWRYGLYDVNGARVTRNSGFPIKYNDGTKEYFGWAGYYGLWLPDSVTIADGATVKKQVFSATGSTETDYILIRKGGKLKKHTQQMLTLTDIKSIPLDYWEWDNTTSTSSNWRVEWDGSKFVKKAKQSQTQTNHMWEDLTATSQPPINTPIDLAKLFWGELNFWSQSLGGQVRVKLTGTTTGTPPAVTVTYSYPTDPTVKTVVFYKEDIIYPGDFTSTASFSCYDNCPQSDTTYGVKNSGWQPSATALTYTFGLDMVLKDSSSVSLLMTTKNPENQWGFMSGPMFEPTKTDSTTGKTYLELLKCDWQEWDATTNTMVDKTCGWKAWSVLPEFYTWETGLDQWNQFTALQGPSPATTIVKFDPPLQVTYTYQKTGNAAANTKYCLDGAATCASGTKFYMDYAGFGELHGIPGVCVDMDSGQPKSCDQNSRWVPEFMIPAEAAVVNGSATYYVKPLEKEQRMSKVLESSCSALTLTSYTMPAISLWVDPALGTEPTITGAPAVVGGVVQ